MGSAGLICREELERTGGSPGSLSLRTNDPVHGNVAMQPVPLASSMLKRSNAEPPLASRSATMALSDPPAEVTKFSDANHCSSSPVNANKSDA